MIKLVILFSLLTGPGYVEKEVVKTYLEKINFVEGLSTKYLLILPLNSNYYVDNHWVKGLLNLPNPYPALSVVIVERDVALVRRIITNNRLKIAFDDKTYFYWTSFYTGEPILLERKDKGYEIKILTIRNAYQEKLSLYKKIR